MKCDSCGKENANIHMTSIVNGAKEEHHYCQQCANQKEQGGGNMFSSMFDDSFLIINFLPMLCILKVHWGIANRLLAHNVA